MEIIQAPKTYKELEARINLFMTRKKPSPKKPISPRLFRISLGVSKQTLSNWKSNPNRRTWFDLIKTCEDILLAFIEQKTIDISQTITHSSTKVSTNVIGLINTLRAYDSHRYIPESRPVKNDEQNNLPIVVDLTNKSKLKLTDLTKE